TKKARSFHDDFFNLLYPDVQRHLDGLTLTELANFHDVAAIRFVMSNSMLNREARALFVEVFKLRGEVVILKNQQFESAHVVSKLEADLERLEMGRVLGKARLFVTLKLRIPSFLRMWFKEKEVVFLTMDASLQLKIEALKDTLDLVDQERSSLVKDLFPHVVERLLSSIGLELESMKDYGPNIEETYDRAVDTFYLVKFSYVDLLVHFSDQCLGKLITLKPPIIHSSNTSGAGPSVNPFL
ncbi:hypothetical protein Tco_1498125, partial [Tanacetum coccineum]